MTDEQLQMMMLDIDGILTRSEATPTDVLAAAQTLAVSAIGDLVNKSRQPLDISPQTSDISPQTSDISPQSSDISPQPSDISPQTSAALHQAADAIAAQIREALHRRIDEGHRPDW